jgi:very-short-patch-repair endonuclease
MRLGKPTTSRHRAQLLRARASDMRRAPTASEGALFELVRRKKLGAQFRRQMPIGRFIADLFAPTVRLVVEIDGGYHHNRARADARRDLAMKRAGLHVLRLDAQLELAEPETAVQLIAAAVERLR